MTKRFFLAALTAVALSMGFTACSDDDENERFTGNYKLSGTVSIGSNNSDETEYDHILSTYCEALGITEGDGFTIKGKDSLDCVSNILTCCMEAEAKLAGQSWSGVYSVDAMDEGGKTSFYTQEYGESGDNGLVHYPFLKVDAARKSSKWVAEKTSEIKDNTFISGLFTQYVGSNECCPPDLGWPESLYYSLARVTKSNKNAVYVAMSDPYYTEDEVKAMYQNDDPKLNTLIGDVKVLYFYHGNYPEEFTYNGAKYEVCRGDNGTGAPIDLNYKSGGPYMYLYVSHDVKHFGRVLNAKWTSFIAQYKKNFFFGDTSGEGNNALSELVQGIYQDNSGNLSDHYEDGVDFLLGTGHSDFLKMRVGYLPLEYMENFKAVDLGLPSGTKWANMNLGANRANEIGSYFAWGESFSRGNQHKDYSRFDYRWYYYGEISKYNKKDKLWELEPEDDAAYVNLGSNWRIPSNDQIDELKNNCNLTWTTRWGVDGLQATSKINGNSIFLPICHSLSQEYQTSYAVQFWSRSRADEWSARLFLRGKTFEHIIEIRYLGIPIRPVYVE